MKHSYVVINRDLGAISNYFKWPGFPNDYIVLYKFILQITYYTEFFLDNKFVKHLQHHPEALTEIASSLINNLDG